MILITFFFKCSLWYNQIYLSIFKQTTFLPSFLYCQNNLLKPLFVNYKHPLLKHLKIIIYMCLYRTYLCQLKFTQRSFLTHSLVVDSSLCTWWCKSCGSSMQWIILALCRSKHYTNPTCKQREWLAVALNHCMASHIKYCHCILATIKCFHIYGRINNYICK